MKNALKKIAAVAMAFTLIGAGTTISKTVYPQTNNTLVANAACNHNQLAPQHVYKSYFIRSYYNIDGRLVKVWGWSDTAYCRCCGKQIGFTFGQNYHVQ